MSKIRLGGALVVLTGLCLILASQTAASTSARGCKVVSRTHTQKSIIFREVLFRFQLRVSFCYDGQRIVQAGESCFIDHQDPVTIVSNGCTTQHYYFVWDGKPQGGYYAQASAAFQNCLLRYGCWSQGTMTLRIWAQADGSVRRATTT